MSAKTPVFELFIEFPSSDSHHTVQIPTQLLRWHLPFHFEIATNTSNKNMSMQLNNYMISSIKVVWDFSATTLSTITTLDYEKFCFSIG